MEPAKSSEDLQRNNGLLFYGIPGSGPNGSVVPTADLTALSGWHKLGIEYRSAAETVFTFTLDDTQVMQSTYSAANAPLGYFTIGAGGQYRNVGHLLVDDVLVTSSVPETLPLSTTAMTLVGLCAFAAFRKRQ